MMLLIANTVFPGGLNTEVSVIKKKLMNIDNGLRVHPSWENFEEGLQTENFDYFQ